MRVWIDTDIGSDVDDALTLGYVLREPRFELVGVSTVFGDVPLRTRIAEALLDVAGVSGVPVLPGLGKPLTEKRTGVMFGHEGEGLVEGAGPRLRVLQEDPGGPDRLDALAAALEAAGPDVLLAIGPLTNLGALANDGFALPPLAIMGGKFADVLHEGMVPQIPEWNWWSDPVAVQQVLASPHAGRPRVVPAEVTFRTELAPGDVELLAGGDELARTLAALCERWLRVQALRFGAKRPRVALHDPLTAAVLVEPRLCPFAERRARIDDGAAAHDAADAPPLEVATDVDLPALQRLLRRAFLGASAESP